MLDFWSRMWGIMHGTIHAAHTRSVGEIIECKMIQGSGRNLFTAPGTRLNTPMLTTERDRKLL